MLLTGVLEGIRLAMKMTMRLLLLSAAGRAGARVRRLLAQSRHPDAVPSCLVVDVVGEGMLLGRYGWSGTYRYR
jgi:hypothetical protein